jgi:crotonobetainyl-CoA:carnitine CoA-transferase CaiB-like acyl-CoA transferase
LDASVIRGLTGDLACYRIYRAGDGKYLTVGALENQFWKALCETLDCEDLIPGQYGPPEQQRAMADRLQEIFDTRPRDEWVKLFRDVPACVGPVNDLTQAMEDPQVQHRNMVAAVEGRAVGPGAPIKMVEPGIGPRAQPADRSSPGLGEHTEEVLQALLGMDRDEIGQLRGAGAI